MSINVNKINQNNNYGIGAPKINAEYSSLKMANTIQGTGDMGLLIPAHIHEMLPSQKINLNQSIGIQFNPFVTNLFHEINGEMMTYFVPFRILWDEWEEFITGGIDGENNTAHPTMSLNTLYETHAERTDGHNRLEGTLSDYFGMPIRDQDLDNSGDAYTMQPTAFLWWAYNKIYNDHIRIPDIEPNEVDLNNNEVLRGNYDYDYFTRARVYQQRGESPSIPISDDLEQLEHEWINATTEETQENKILNIGGSVSGINAELYWAEGGPGTGSLRPIKLAPHDLEAFGMNMNDFLLGLGILRMQINNAKTQPRYIEQLQMRFGIYPQDSRLQRPEYLGSNYFQIAVDTVTQTSASTDDSAQGNITAQAWGNGTNMGSSYTAQEHGLLMTIFIIRPKNVYEGGLNRQWIKKTRFDYPTPELANTPDVPIYKGQLRYQGKDTNDYATFGYQGIYEEYRTLLNQVVGELRPSDPNGLASYTLARYFCTAPSLNKEFIQCNPDQDRILQYTNEPAFIYFIRNSINTALPLPVQAEPGDLSFI